MRECAYLSLALHIPNDTLTKPNSKALTVEDGACMQEAHQGRVVLSQVIPQDALLCPVYLRLRVEQQTPLCVAVVLSAPTLYHRMMREQQQQVCWG